MSWTHLFRASTLLIATPCLITAGWAAGPASADGSADYIPDASYYLLMAEIAIQRKEYLTAAEEYSNAAAQSTDPELASRATEFAFEYGYEAFALNGARRWLELDPENQLAHEYAARLYFRRNELDRSLEHWRAALGPVAERSEEDYFSLATDLADEEDAAGVTTLLTRLVVEAPDAPVLRLLLGQAALRSGAFELALGSAQRAIRDDSEWIEPQILKARAYLSMGAEYQALEIMEALLAKQPFLGFEMEFARMLAASGRSTRAMEYLRELVEKYGVHPELVRLHGLLSLSLEDLDSADQDFRELAKRGENVYEAFYYLAQIALAREEYREGIRFLNRIMGGAYLFPAQLSISGAYHSLDQHQAGLNHLKKFATNYPRYAIESLRLQAQLLHQAERYDDALATYDLLLRFQPHRVDIMILRAVSLEESGRLDQAIDAMRQVIEIAPLNPAALNTLGYTLANRTRRYSEAYRLIRLALELEPESPAIIDSMGWVLYRQGELDAARSYLELAYSMLDDPELVAHLGEVLWATGEQERATELWDSSLLKNPDSEPLKTTRQKFLQ